MITEWFYNNDIDGIRNRVKKIIETNNFKSIDIGAAAYYWSYPECKIIADSIKINKPDVLQFEIDIENKNQYNSIFDYVKNNGIFDFTICSHTLEDVFNPLDLIELLQKISKRGFIAIPSKYDEFNYLNGNNFLGNSHHKTIFDVKEDNLFLFPKYSFIETNKNSEQIRNNYKGKELCIFWENEIPSYIFGKGIPFRSDGELINEYFRQIT